jgi:ribosomal protein S18 acetylase RimI-like enzyme
MLRRMTDETLIRPGEARDLPAVIALVRGLAEFEKLPGPDAAAEERFARDLGKRYEMLVAETNAEGGAPAIIGYALYFYTYSTFLALPSLYLEDLYVDPALRGRGIGERFMRRLAAEAETQGCGRFEWTVLDWNVRAQKFYKSLGAELLDDWRVCRVSGDGIKRLASAR